MACMSSSPEVTMLSVTRCKSWQDREELWKGGVLQEADGSALAGPCLLACVSDPSATCRCPAWHSLQIHRVVRMHVVWPHSPVRPDSNNREYATQEEQQNRNRRPTHARFRARTKNNQTHLVREPKHDRTANNKKGVQQR
eukprot:1136866-Pelagomonas_calceolata.AAC.3